MLRWLRALRDPHALISGRTFSRVRPHVLKHVPGKRCVIAYELFDGNEACGRVIGKLYRKDRGRAIFENLQSVWRAAHAEGVSATTFAMPRPLAYYPETGMVLQQAAPGEALANIKNCDALLEAVQHTARNLAALHRLPLPQLARRSWQDHLNKYCHPGPQALVEALPAFEPLVHACLTRMAEDGNLSQAPLCPLHGDLNLTQIFIAAERAYFIDFDGMCLSHAALDAGNFLVALKVHFGEKGEILRHVFLETYLSHAPAALLSGLRTYQAFAYFRRAMIGFRRQSQPDWREHVQEMLATSLAVLA